MNVQLRKFNPTSMADDKVCVFIGKRGTGKSTLITQMLYHKRHLGAGIIVSATEEGNHYYSQYMPDLFVHSEYDKDVIDKVIDRQKKLINSPQKDNCGAFILLDDCMYDNKFLRDSCIRQCFMNGRHWKLFFMLSLQYCMDMPPALRSNVDYVFILRENIRANRERLYKNFAGIFPTFDMFDQVMDACTENFECLVIDNTSRSNKIEDCVFWYKAPYPLPTFKMGSPAFWRFHSSNYNGGVKPPPDAKGRARPKNKPGISIKKLN